MNLKNCLFLNKPYRFKNVCDIYPISVTYAIDFDNEEEFLNMFMPYMLTKDVLADDVLAQCPTLFDVVLSDVNLFSKFVLTLIELCKTDNIKINEATREIVVDGFEETLNKDNFNEFSDVVLEIIQAKRLEKASNKEPHFETKEGRERWLALQKSRQEYAKKHKKNSVCLYDLMNICQFGGNFYIPDGELSSWSYWKLIKTYLTIMNLSDYKNSFDIYLQCGDKKLIENHWSQLIKL